MSYVVVYKNLNVAIFHEKESVAAQEEVALWSWLTDPEWRAVSQIVDSQDGFAISGLATLLLNVRHDAFAEGSKAGAKSIRPLHAPPPYDGRFE